MKAYVLGLLFLFIASCGDRHSVTQEKFLENMRCKVIRGYRAELESVDRYHFGLLESMNVLKFMVKMEGGDNAEFIGLVDELIKETRVRWKNTIVSRSLEGGK